jgi:hypothetical protein
LQALTSARAWSELTDKAGSRHGIGLFLLAALLPVNACASLKNTLNRGADYTSAIKAQPSVPATTEQRAYLLIQS